MEEIKIDLLQKNIDEARSKLTPESRNAIDSVDWKSIILEMKDYTPEQLDALEIETELLLCGLIPPEDYPIELEKGMSINQEQVVKLINDLDKLIFKKIQDELEKIVSRREIKVPDDRLLNTNEKDNQYIYESNQNTTIKQGEKNNIEEEIPLPPYKTTISEQTQSIKKENATGNKIINPLEEKMTRPFSSNDTMPQQNPTSSVDPYRELV